MAELKFDLKDKRIAILGSGGTARSILSVMCLINDRPESIKIYNRTLGKAEILVKQLGQKLDASLVEVVNTPEDLNIELADLLINTTSVGLNGEDTLLIDPALLHRDMLVYDCIYNPAQTALIASAALKGAKTANGLGMLYYQGVLAFKHWAGIDIEDKYKKIMRKALEDGIKK